MKKKTYQGSKRIKSQKIKINIKRGWLWRKSYVFKLMGWGLDSIRTWWENRLRGGRVSYLDIRGVKNKYTTKGNEVTEGHYQQGDRKKGSIGKGAGNVTARKTGSSKQKVTTQRKSQKPPGATERKWQIRIPNLKWIHTGFLGGQRGTTLLIFGGMGKPSSLSRRKWTGLGQVGWTWGRALQTTDIRSKN